MRETPPPAIRRPAPARPAAAAGLAWVAVLALACVLLAASAVARTAAIDSHGLAANGIAAPLQDNLAIACHPGGGPQPAPAAAGGSAPEQPAGTGYLESAFDGESSGESSWLPQRTAVPTPDPGDRSIIPASARIARLSAAALLPPAHAPPAIA